MVPPPWVQMSRTSANRFFAPDSTMFVAMRVESNMNSRIETLIPIPTWPTPNGGIGCTNRVTPRRFISPNHASKRESPR